MQRRSFIKYTSLLAAGWNLGSTTATAALHSPISRTNKLPKWKGFNLLDFFTPVPAGDSRNKTAEDHFRWMRDWGFDGILACWTPVVRMWRRKTGMAISWINNSWRCYRNIDAYNILFLPPCK